MTDTADAPQPPRTIVAAFVATIASAVLSVISAALWFGYKDYIRHELLKANSKAKTPKHPYDLTSHQGRHNVNHDLSNSLTSGLIQSLIFGLAIVLIAMQVRRGRGWARWLLIILFALPLGLLPSTPYRLLTIGGSAPALTRVVDALVGLAALAVIVLLLLPESMRYFAAVRAEQLGERGESSAPTGLRGLFAPRTPSDAATSGTTAASKPSKPRLPEKPVAARPAKPDPAAPAAKQAKAKVRTSADAEASPPPARPTGTVAGKSRSKSRKGS